MKIRIMVMISFLNYANMYPMWAKFSTWFEDPTPHIAIVKCIKPANKLCYLALLEKAQEDFPHIAIQKDVSIVQLICFDRVAKQKVMQVPTREKKIKQLGSTITYCPLSLLQDGKEGRGVQVGSKMFICDQKTIESVTLQEKLAALKKDKGL